MSPETALVPGGDFGVFLARHQEELARQAFLLTADDRAADEVAADALVALWRDWDDVCTSGHPLVYARRMVIVIADRRWANRTTAAFAARRRVIDGSGIRRSPDPQVVTTLAALQRMPFRRRAVVVLRFALGLSDSETATVLEITERAVRKEAQRGAVEVGRRVAPFAGAGAGMDPADGDDRRLARLRGTWESNLAGDEA